MSTFRKPALKVVESIRKSLHNAERSYDFPGASHQIEQGCAINGPDSFGKTPFHDLLKNVEMNQLKTLQRLKVLVDSKCDINTRDENGETPLSLAVYNELEDAALFLVKNGADTSVTSPKFKRNHSLATRIAEKMPEVMKAILDSGVGMKQESKQFELNFKPILQYCVDPDLNAYGVNADYKQREASFLYSLVVLDSRAETTYLKHPLVCAFLERKAGEMPKLINIIGVGLATLFPYFYAVFITYLSLADCCHVRDKAGNCGTNNVRNKTGNYTNTLYCTKSLPNTFTAWVLFAWIAASIVVEIAMIETARRYSNDEFQSWGMSAFKLDKKLQDVSNALRRNWKSWVAVVSLSIMVYPLLPGLLYTYWPFRTWQYLFAAVGIFFSCIIILIKLDSWLPSAGVYVDMLMGVWLRVIKLILLFTPLLLGFYNALRLMFYRVSGTLNFILMMAVIGSAQVEEMLENPKDDSELYRFIANLFAGAFIVMIPIMFMSFVLTIAIEEMQGLKRDPEILRASSQIQNSLRIEILFTVFGVRSIGNYFSPTLFSEQHAIKNTCCSTVDPCNTRHSPNVCKELAKIIKSKKHVTRKTTLK